jgi:hypothetical protein
MATRRGTSTIILTESPQRNGAFVAAASNVPHRHGKSSRDSRVSSPSRPVFPLCEYGGGPERLSRYLVAAARQKTVGRSSAECS